MSLLDGDGNPLNIPFPTMGGEVFWDDLDYRGQYTLQQNILNPHHCRILDEDNIRVAWGEEGPMRAKLRELTNDPGTDHAQYGDIIGVHRLGGLYDHYGVYESDDCIYEYAAHDGDFGEADIHITTLSKFIKDSGNYFVLTFPQKHGTPGKVPMPVTASTTAVSGTISTLGGSAFFLLEELIENLVGSTDYHLYSPEETIQRAKSRLGEDNYDLLSNNCEHFVLWCKTGIHESHQVDKLLKYLNAIPKEYIKPKTII